VESEGMPSVDIRLQHCTALDMLGGLIGRGAGPVDEALCRLREVRP
jgi:hypothetical protein